MKAIPEKKQRILTSVPGLCFLPGARQEALIRLSDVLIQIFSGESLSMGEIYKHALFTFQVPCCWMFITLLPNIQFTNLFSTFTHYLVDCFQSSPFSKHGLMLKFTLYPIMILNFWASCLPLQRAGIAVLYHHIFL